MALLPPLPDPLPEPDPEPLPEPLPPDPEPDVDELEGSITSSQELKKIIANRTAMRASVNTDLDLEINVCMGFILSCKSTTAKTYRQYQQICIYNGRPTAFMKDIKV
jgi:hypothetical protein